MTPTLQAQSDFVGRDREIGQFKQAVQANLISKKPALLGFYGMGGIGKSHLLREFARIARTVTPYVIELNFDPAHSAAPTDPATILRALVTQLEATGQTTHKTWLATLLPFLFKPVDLLAGCKQCLYPLTHLSHLDIKQTIEARDGSTVTGSQQRTQLGDYSQIDPATTALKQAFPNFPRHATLFSHLKIKYQSRPLMVVLVDTLEYAGDAALKWLQRLQFDGFSRHCILVMAGRDTIKNLLDTELPPLSDTEVATYLSRNYILDDTIRAAVAQASGGIPLLLQVATELVQEFPDLPPTAFETGPERRQLTLALLFERYLDRLRARWEQEPDPTQRRKYRQEYYLLYYGAVLQSYESAAQLRAVFEDLPHTESAFTDQDDYGAMLRYLERKSFVTDGRLHRSLRQHDSDLFRKINNRAQSYYAQQGDLVAEYYHRLLPDPAAAFTDFSHAIETALAANDFSLAAALFNVMADLPLTTPQQQHLTFLKVLLAYQEGNQAKAVERYNRLQNLDTPPFPLTPYSRSILETWITDLEAQDQTDQTYYRLKLWFIRIPDSSQDPETERHAEAEVLYELGRVALMQNRSQEAEAYLQAALKLSQDIGYKVGQANALAELVRLFQIQSQRDEAQRYLAQLVQVVGQNALNQVPYWPEQIEKLAQSLDLIYLKETQTLMQFDKEAS